MRPIKLAALVAPSLVSIGLFALTFAAGQNESAAAATAGEAIWEIK
jgi:hypothetical protein